MKINEIIGDIFSDDEGYFAQCISQDYKMSIGIAADFNHKFELKYKLSRINSKVPDCILVNKVFNLISKKKYWYKTTYNDLKECIKKMKSICAEKKIKKISMPKIGCDLDELDWSHVRKIITDIFKDVDIEINVYEV